MVMFSETLTLKSVIYGLDFVDKHRLCNVGVSILTAPKILYPFKNNKEIGGYLTYFFIRITQ